MSPLLKHDIETSGLKNAALSRALIHQKMSSRLLKPHMLGREA